MGNRLPFFLTETGKEIQKMCWTGCTKKIDSDEMNFKQFCCGFCKWLNN